MWLMKPSMMDDHAMIDERRCQPVPRQQHIANFSYPRAGSIHFCPKEQPAIRSSQGSDSSPPQLVEDHGSDLSAEDDFHYRISEVNSWNSWHMREEQRREPNNYSAPIDAAGPHRDTSQGPATKREDFPTTGNLLDSACPSGQPARRDVSSSPVQSPRPPRTPTKTRYSLFPSPTDPSKRNFVPAQTSTTSRPPGLEASPLSHHFPSPPRFRMAAADGKNKAAAVSRPGSSRAPTPSSMHGVSIAASSSDSIPLLLRSPGPTPPHSPSTRTSSDCPKHLPFEPKGCSPQHTSLPNSLSRTTTRSSPSLANLAQTQRQVHPPGLPTKDMHPSTPVGLYRDRPLPPLPVERCPSPPQISVFETDSDDEDDDNSQPTSPQSARNLARRFMHGLVHHNNHHNDHRGPDKRKGKSPVLRSDHKRSISDDGSPTSSSAAATAGDKGFGADGVDDGRTGISRTLDATAKRSRIGGSGGATTAIKAAASRGAVSMDLPRCAGAASAVGGEEQQAGRWEGEKTATGKKRGDLFLGRILRRKRLD
ncbi:hypothetical protein P885DRAFT_32162 [Corynascus similis CBS 632.67]